MRLADAIDAFDRAAFGLISWTTALAGYAAATGAHIGQIAAVDRQGRIPINLVTGLAEDQLAEYLETGGPDPAINPRTRAVIAAPALHTIAENDFGTPEALRAQPFYARYFARHDMPFCAMTKLAEADGQTVAVALLRSGRAGHVTDDQRRMMDIAAPRLRDAVLATLALERRQLDLATGTLDALAIPAFALDADARIVRMSSQGEAMLCDGAYLARTRGRLSPAAAEARAGFARAVRALARSRAPADRIGASLLLPSGHGGAMVASLIPLPADTHGWLHTACCLAAIRPAPADPRDRSIRLARTYALTPSECDVAILLAEGRDARTIARIRHVSEGTVRNQIKAVLGKTGCHRQAELVARLRY